MATGLESAAMAGYTKTNLKGADDVAAESGLDVEARIGRKHMDSEHLGVSYFRFGPGERAPYGHKHSVQEEAYVVVSGSGRMKLDDELIDLAQWDLIRVAPEVIRGIEGGPDGIELVIVGSDRPPDGDGEMVHDWWTD